MDKKTLISKLEKLESDLRGEARFSGMFASVCYEHCADEIRNIINEAK